MNNIQSLHGHTTASDGTLSHLEYLNAAHKYGVSTVAFTDHDGLPSEKTVKLLFENKNHPTKWIIGIEISSGLPKEVGGGPYSGFHIVGLFVDPTNRELLEHCRKSQIARVSRMEKIVKNLKGLGFDINEADCLMASGGEAVGRPHIVKALKSKSQNLKVIDQLIDQMRKDSQADETLKQKYNLLIERKEDQAPYMLFLSDDSYIPGIYVEYEYWAEMHKTVSLIRNAGGLAIVAHYSTAKNKVPFKLLETFILDKSIDGVETVYGVRGLKGTEQTEWDKDREVLDQMINKYDSLKGGGADIHTIEDFDIFRNHPDYSNNTVNMAEEIIRKSKVSTFWSNY